MKEVTINVFNPHLTSNKISGSISEIRSTLEESFPTHKKEELEQIKDDITLAIQLKKRHFTIIEKEGKLNTDISFFVYQADSKEQAAYMNMVLSPDFVRADGTTMFHKKI